MLLKQTGLKWPVCLDSWVLKPILNILSFRSVHSLGLISLGQEQEKWQSAQTGIFLAFSEAKEMRVGSPRQGFDLCSEGDVYKLGYHHPGVIGRNNCRLGFRSGEDEDA